MLNIVCKTLPTFYLPDNLATGTEKEIGHIYVPDQLHYLFSTSADKTTTSTIVLNSCEEELAITIYNN